MKMVGQVIEKIIMLLHAFIGWTLCGVIIAIGRKFMPMNTTLIVHAVGSPLIFTGISVIYFKKFNYTKPLTTALIFICFVIFMDFFLVALLIEKSLDMFKSVIGTWFPFILIFMSVYMTGMTLIGEKEEVKCMNCKYEGIGKFHKRGSPAIEAALWVFFFPLGFLCSVLRRAFGYYTCPQCNIKIESSKR